MNYRRLLIQPEMMLDLLRLKFSPDIYDVNGLPDDAVIASVGLHDDRLMLIIGSRTFTPNDEAAEEQGEMQLTYHDRRMDRVYEAKEEEGGQAARG